ncbi:hypothetical protein V6N13_114542 [Hibiscus sabdariffa]
MPGVWFIDNCLVFGTTSTGEAMGVKNVLDQHGSYFGQFVNFNKFSLFFSTNMLDDTRRDVRRVLRISKFSTQSNLKSCYHG